MKLYIPTCTLNLNNILSTESISPPSFYPQRKFGIKRFEKIKAGDVDHLIVLYSALPSYELQAQGLDNYPMVIEVETATLATAPRLCGQKDGVNVYTYGSTIYLNPASTIIYVNEGVFPIIQSRADESGENKLFSLYHAAKCFKRIPAAKPSFKWTPSYVETMGGHENIDREKEIEKDYIIDRLKGFAYCYLIGANSSVPKELAELRVHTKNIKNTLAAIINSPTRKPTTVQDEKLLNDVKQFNAIFQSVDKVCIQNREKVDNGVANADPYRDGLTKETFLKLLERAGLKEAFERKCGVCTEYDAIDLYSCITCPDAAISNEYSRVISDLSSAVACVERDQEQIKANPKDMFILAPEGNVDMLDKTFHLNRYNDFINALIRREQEKENLPKSLAIAVMCGSILKKHFGEQWEGSPTQKYLNGLLGSLQESSRSFDLNSTDSNELRALGAFAQKGSDIDKLSNYLLNCGFSDYRLAYGLYGATEGFATLPKTFTHGLLSKADSYTWSVYKYIYQGCLGVSLDAYHFGEKDESIASAGMLGPGEYKSAAMREDISHLLHDLEQNVPKFCEIKKEENKRKIIENLKPYYEGRIDSIFFEKVKALEAPKGSATAWKACIRYFEQSLKTHDASNSKNVNIKSSPNIKIEQASLLVKPAKSFFEDAEAYHIIDDFLLGYNVNTEIREKILGNLKWLQDNYLPGRKYFLDEKNNPRDNASVINHFKNLCFRAPKDKIDNSQKNKDLLDALVKELSKIYSWR